MSEDRCAGIVEAGRLHVRLLPEVGFFGAYATLTVGDTLRLRALLQAETGAHIDFLGTGGCSLEFGEPLPTEITWRTSQPSTLTVVENGLMIGRAEGVATVIARATPSGIEASREITVHSGYPFGNR